MSFKEQLEEKKTEVLSKEYLSDMIKESVRNEVGITEEEVSIESLDENIFSRAWNRLKSLFSTLDFNSLSFSAYQNGNTVYLFTEQDGSNYFYEIEGGEIVDSMERISANKHKTKMREVIQMGAKQITSKRRMKRLFTKLNDQIQTDARYKFSPVRAVTGIFAASAAANFDDIADLGVDVYESGGDIVISKTAELASDLGELMDNVLENMNLSDYAKVENFFDGIFADNTNMPVSQLTFDRDVVEIVAKKVDIKPQPTIDVVKQSVSFIQENGASPDIPNYTPQVPLMELDVPNEPSREFLGGVNSMLDDELLDLRWSQSETFTNVVEQGLTDNTYLFYEVGENALELDAYQTDFVTALENVADREYATELINNAGAAANLGGYLETISLEDLEVLADQEQGVKDAMANMDMGERIQYATTLIQNAQ